MRQNDHGGLAVKLADLAGLIPILTVAYGVVLGGPGSSPAGSCSVRPQRTAGVGVSWSLTWVASCETPLSRAA